MRVTAVAALARELEEDSSGRTVWDREGLYRAMIRWGNGMVVPAERRVRARTAIGKACRLASRLGRPIPRWRTAALNRWLADVAQVQRFVVPGDVELMYGNITFPEATSGVPTVWSTQGVLDARPGQWVPRRSAQTHARLVDRAAATHCWSQLGLNGLLEYQPHVDTSRIHVIPPLIDIDLPDPWPREHDGIGVIFIGAFGLLKGVDVAVEAMRRLPTDIHLDVICADTPPERLPSNVTWLGARPRPEVLSRLRSADIHLFASRTESFGVAAVEAMAAGIPQVVATGTVPSEIVGATGVAVPGRDAGAIADAVETLARDDAERRELGRLARQRYERVFSAEAVGRRLEEMFDSL